MREEISLVNELKGDLYGAGEQPNDNVIDKFMRYALAKRFSRDIGQVREGLKSDCKQPGIYSRATYSIKRGGSNVTGTTIRMAETLMRHWGNMNVETFSQRKEDSTLITVQAWDYERNVGETKQFEMKHVYYTSSARKALGSEMNIREQQDAIAARLRRACILALIPQWLQDEALNWCDKAAEMEDDADVNHKVAKMVDAFKILKISSDEVRKMVSVGRGQIIEAKHLAELRKIYSAIKEGHSTKEDYLPEEKKAKKTMDDVKLEEKEETKTETKTKSIDDKIIEDIPWGDV